MQLGERRLDRAMLSNARTMVRRSKITVRHEARVIHFAYEHWAMR